SNDQRVDEVTDNSTEVCMASARRRGARDQLFLTCVTIEQSVKCGQQRRKKRRIVRFSQFLQRLRQFGIKTDNLHRARESFYRRSWSNSWQIHDRKFA